MWVWDKYWKYTFLLSFTNIMERSQNKGSNLACNEYCNTGFDISCSFVNAVFIFYLTKIWGILWGNARVIKCDNVFDHKGRADVLKLVDLAQLYMSKQDEEEEVMQVSRKAKVLKSAFAWNEDVSSKLTKIPQHQQYQQPQTDPRFPWMTGGDGHEQPQKNGKKSDVPARPKTTGEFCMGTMSKINTAIFSPPLVWLKVLICWGTLCTLSHCVVLQFFCERSPKTKNKTSDLSSIRYRHVL